MKSRGASAILVANWNASAKHELTSARNVNRQCLMPSGMITEGIANGISLAMSNKSIELNIPATAEERERQRISGGWDKWYASLPEDLRRRLSLHDFKRLGDCFRQAFNIPETRSPAAPAQDTQAQDASVSDTPRTQAEISRTAQIGAVSGMEQAWEDMCEFSRELERELVSKTAENSGMYLRDHFAAAALTGIMGNSWSPVSNQFALAAHNAYKLADAMLAAREKK